MGFVVCEHHRAQAQLNLLINADDLFIFAVGVDSSTPFIKCNAMMAR